jgi:hypothetical protein
MNRTLDRSAGALRRQGGMSMIGLLILVFLIGGAVLIAFRLLPHYYEYWLVKSAMDRLKEEPPTEVVAQKLGAALDNQLYIDNVRGVKRQDIKIRPTPDGYEIKVDYEVREPLVGNVDAILNFDHQVVIPRRW